MKTIKDVVEMMEQGSRMTIEMMAYIYILNKHRKIAYTHDEVHDMKMAMVAQSKVEAIQEELEGNSMEIARILTAHDENFNPQELMDNKVSIESYLNKRHNVEIKKISLDEQRAIIKDITGKNVTIEELIEEM